MRPKHETSGSADLFRARLEQIINMKHKLVQLAGKIDWGGSKAPACHPTAYVPDQRSQARWIHDPYFVAREQLVSR
jgi:hypothetical protein